MNSALMDLRDRYFNSARPLPMGKRGCLKRIIAKGVASSFGQWGQFLYPEQSELKNCWSKVSMSAPRIASGFVGLGRGAALRADLRRGIQGAGLLAMTIPRRHLLGQSVRVLASGFALVFTEAR